MPLGTRTGNVGGGVRNVKHLLSLGLDRELHTHILSELSQKGTRGP